MRPAHGAEFIVDGYGVQEEGSAAAPTACGETGCATAATAGKTVNQQLYRGTVDD